MKRIFPILLTLALLSGCGGSLSSDPPPSYPIEHFPLSTPTDSSVPYTSHFPSETVIILSDEGIEVTGVNAGSVYTSNDIIYYEDRTTYDSGNPYGEGQANDRHSAVEAAAHTVVNITAPGAYRVSGKLSAGQIRVDLGKKADETPDALVELILENADITCTVAPVILFLNVYECDGNRSEDNAQPDVDTTAAGANLILQGNNTVSGSHVAKIFKDNDAEKKLWKQDGAIYSYMSMNIFGPGSLDLTADNEGLGSELHLTINGGNIAIRSDNDGINTNEDGVSVTTINGGILHIIAGLGAEGDGIDSNGYLVINGGTVVSSAHPASDAGLDSDLGSFIHGGTVIALGSSMDWAESDSGQVTMNLHFSKYHSGPLAVLREDGTVIFAYDPTMDETLGEMVRSYQGAILSCANFHVAETYHVFLDGTTSGTETGGIYDVSTVTDYSGGTQMMYTGTDLTVGLPGGFRPDGNRGPGGKSPDGSDGKMATAPEGETRPEGPPPDMPEGETPPNGFDGEKGHRPGGFGGNPSTGKGNPAFYMQDKVNFFTGLTPLN